MLSQANEQHPSHPQLNKVVHVTGCALHPLKETSALNYPTTGLLWPSAGAGAEHLHPADEVDGGMKMSPGLPACVKAVIFHSVLSSRQKVPSVEFYTCITKFSQAVPSITTKMVPSLL